MPHVTPELLGLVSTGTVYSLAVNYYEGMPKPAPMVPYTISARNRHGDLKGIEPATFAAESITMAAHTGTHIDALCHIGERQDAQGQPSADGEPRLYADQGETVPAAESASHQGLMQMNIAQMPPIITRAVLLDVAGMKGVDVLPDAYMITVEDIEATIARQATIIQPGTAVLLRTGFYHHLANGNPAYVDQIAGPGLAAAQFLVEQA